MKTLVFLDKFNNYFNRKIIFYSNPNDYTSNRRSRTFENINFNPNDSVKTEIIINWDQEWFPDYLLVEDNINNEFVIVSRWFVIESTRTREGQYNIQLKRDTISDFNNQVFNAPTFIEKANLTANDPLIYNDEGMVFNQKKIGETLLKDRTGMAWLVGYCTQDTNRYPSNYDGWKGTSEIKTIISANNIPQWIRNAFNTNKKFAIREDSQAKLGLRMQARSETNILGKHAYGIFHMENVWAGSATEVEALGDIGSDSWATAIHVNFSFNVFTEWGDNIQSKLKRVIQTKTGQKIYEAFNNNQTYRISLMSNLRSDLGLDTYSRLQSLRYYNGMTYKDGNKYYKIHAVTVQTGELKKGYLCTASNSALGYFRTIMQSGASTTSGSEGTYTFINDTTTGKGFVEMITGYTEIFISRQEVYSGETTPDQSIYETAEITVHISGDRRHTLNQPFDMFCIPYGDLQCYGWKTIKDVGLLAARTLAQAGAGSSSVIYDVQLLPYCPIQDLYQSGHIYENSLIEERDYTYITDQYNNKLSIMFWCRNTDFSFNIEQPFSIPRETGNPYALDLKLASQCDMCRLSSPNYNGIFDFNIAKNDGYVDFFNVDCTYKPYNPYIHISPNFHGLYGQDWDDSRGLICGGDFSIALMTDLWKQYELQNKNYQQTFNLSISTLDGLSNVARNNLYASTVNDVFNNNAASAFKGAMSGGVAGGIVAGVNATVNTGFKLGQGLYTINETNNIIKNRLTNNFMYQLGNIEALPNSLSKTSAFTLNNKIFPFVELYSCTPEEREALKLKIKYDGMTVMKIGKIIDYIQSEESFIKGQIIRLEEISDDTHILNDIYNEIKQGVYL